MPGCRWATHRLTMPLSLPKQQLFARIGWGLVGSLALFSAGLGLALWGTRLELQAAKADLSAVKQDLGYANSAIAALQAQAKQDADQSDQRQRLKEPVKQAAKAVKQGAPNEDRPLASDAQLARLRALAAAANAAAASASDLP